MTKGAGVTPWRWTTDQQFDCCCETLWGTLVWVRSRGPEGELFFQPPTYLGLRVPCPGVPIIPRPIWDYDKVVLPERVELLNLWHEDDWATLDHVRLCSRSVPIRQTPLGDLSIMSWWRHDCPPGGIGRALKRILQSCLVRRYCNLALQEARHAHLT
jgi:hypothetical protein